MDDILAWADRQRPAFRQAFFRAIESARRVIPEEALVEMIETKDFNAIYRLAAQVVNEGFWQGQASAFVTALTTTATGPMFTTALVPGLTQPLLRALGQIRDHGAELVTGVAAETIGNIRTVLVAGHKAGIGAPAMGRLIRGVVGLLPGHADAVIRYDQGMREKGVADQVRQKNVETYRRRLLAWRAENIARTESVSAAHAGQVAAWVEGFPDHKVRWVTTEDDRACARCVPMDGQEVVVGEMFTATVKGFPEGISQVSTPGSRRRRKSGIKPGTPREEWREEWLDGTTVALPKPIRVPWPPLHPSCRCTLVLLLDT